MAKTKTPETAVQKAANAARDAFQKAKDAHEKQNTAASKKALDSATDNMRTAVKAENRERFLAVGNRRTIKARAAIRQLVKVANRKSYEYTDDESNKILHGLDEAIGDVRKAFSTTTTAAGASGDSFRL